VGQIKRGEYPQAALDYVAAALEKPTEGYPALAYTWIVISQLDKLETAPGGGAIRAKMAEYRQKAADRPPHELVSAWLCCNEAAAVEFIKSEGAQGNWRYVASLWYKPDLARELFADPASRIVPNARITSELAGRWLDMQNYWADVKPEDEDLLVVISERADDPGNTLRAAGWILRQEPDYQRFIDYLELGMKEAGPGKVVLLMGATEGIKISRNPKLTDILVDVVKTVQIRGETPPFGQKESDEANTQQLLVAYALCFLPGEQARLMRSKLLNARDPRIQWQSRLGELLHGNPGPWDEAIAEEKDLSNAHILVALDRVDSPEPALLPTYKRFAESENSSVRIRALDKLARFRPYTDNEEVTGLVEKLMRDEAPEVRSAAWYAAGKLGIGDPLEVLGDKEESPEVRLAAAYAALMHAQGGPPDMRDASYWSITGGEGFSASVASSELKENSQETRAGSEAQEDGE
jgi:hypothetical protein